MKLCLKILAIAVVAAFTYSMIGCAAPAGYSYSNVSISLTAGCTDCPAGVTFNPAYPVPASQTAAVSVSPIVASETSSAIPAGAVLTATNQSEGSTLTFYASVTNAPSNDVSWQIFPTPNLGGITILPTGTTTPVTEGTNPLGTINAASGGTIYYTVPSPPVYSGAALVQAKALGIPQGDVLLQASAPNNPANPSSVTTLNQLIQIYSTSPSTYLTPNTPTTPAGLTNPAVTVARNTSYAFFGGTVGAAPCTTPTACLTISPTAPVYSTDNGTVWAVGPAPAQAVTAVAGGNSTWGTISNTGVYTAPATIPATTTGTSIAGEVVVYTFTHSSCAAGACILSTSTAGGYAYVGIN
jgi:hypothetical protein